MSNAQLLVGLCMVGTVFSITIGREFATTVVIFPVSVYSPTKLPQLSDVY